MELISKALSDSDIRQALNNDVNIVKYSELKNMKNIDELLRNDRAVILFELKKNDGHWCSVVRNKERIIFTDSYGMFPENEIDYIPVSFKYVSKQDRGYLLKLLYNQNLPVHFSQYRLQKLENGINTCGRYCVIRCIMKELNEDEFAKMLKSSEYSPDELVSILTYDV